MKPARSSNDKISFSYKGASIFASGRLAKVIAYSFVGLMIVFGIAALQSAFNDRNKHLPQGQKQLQ